MKTEAVCYKPQIFVSGENKRGYKKRSSAINNSSALLAESLIALATAGKGEVKPYNNENYPEHADIEVLNDCTYVEIEPESQNSYFTDIKEQNLEKKSNSSDFVANRLLTFIILAGIIDMLAKNAKINKLEKENNSLQSENKILEEEVQNSEKIIEKLIIENLTLQDKYTDLKIDHNRLTNKNSPDGK